MLEKSHVFPALRQRRVAFGEQEGGSGQCGQGLSIGPGSPLREYSGRWRSLVGHDGGMGFPGITIDFAKMGGLPCIRDLRIPVTTVLGQLGAGRAQDEILADFPDLEPEDILEAIRFAAAAVQERELPVLSSS